MKPAGKIVLGVTSSKAVRVTLGQASSLLAIGFDPLIISSATPGLGKVSPKDGIRSLSLQMKREISPGRDLLSFGRLLSVLGREQPVLTNFGTPKAGLLGNVAAWLCRVPCRIYTVHGLRLETARGWKRRLLVLSERIACRCAHRVICVSPSLLKRMLELRLVAPEKAVVVAGGTADGVELERFLPTTANRFRAEQVRRTLDLPRGVPVIGFVGRFTRDKGIPELMEAYRNLQAQYPDLRLLLVGDFEEGDPVPETVRKRILADPKIIRSGFVSDTSPYYHLMDMLVLPTYREGFPGVPLEAQAAAKPVVTTTATGAIDSIQDGKTGILVPVGDAMALAHAIGRLLADPEKRQAMGRQGQEWVAREFSADKVRSALAGECQKLMQEKLGAAGRPNPQQGWAGAVKRTVDILGSALGLIVLSPVMAMVALSIRVTMGTPILFCHTRPGLHAKPFSLLKFRSMREAFDEKGRPLPDGDRLTRLGIWLRTLSLDELPQFWNVLRGDMSLVGPRPLLVEYLARYTPEQARRHDVMPGITGWTQVNGRNALAWEQKFQLDTWYVEHWSLALDCKILASTVWRVIRREGISSEGHATMPKFGDTTQQYIRRRA